jgi:hypothetical protein
LKVHLFCIKQIKLYQMGIDERNPILFLSWLFFRTPDSIFSFCTSMQSITTMHRQTGLNQEAIINSRSYTFPEKERARWKYPSQPKTSFPSRISSCARCGARGRISRFMLHILYDAVHMGGFERVFEECTRALSACDLDSLVPCSIAPLMQSRGQRTRRVREPPNAHTKPNDPPVGPQRRRLQLPICATHKPLLLHSSIALGLKRNFVDAISAAAAAALPADFTSRIGCAMRFASHNQPLRDFFI